MNAEQFRDFVVIPTLERADAILAGRATLNTPAAVELILRTMAHESHFEYVEQIGPGEARGFAQMEVETLHDLVKMLQPRRPEMMQLLQSLCPPAMKFKDALYGVLPFQVIACRLQYWRFPEPLPAAGDVEGLWRYYKKYWNTDLGDAERHEFDRDWQSHGPQDMVKGTYDV